MTGNALHDTYGTRRELDTPGGRFRYYSLPALKAAGFDRVDRLPYSLRILLENLLRHEDGVTVTAEDIRSLAEWDPKSPSEREIAFRPTRVILQDFTGVPAVVDLAVMRDALAELGGDPALINPLIPSDLVIDHSIQVDFYGRPGVIHLNVQREFERNRERYAFLRWGQSAFGNFRVVPPATGIVHQVNLEYLARVVFTTESEEGGEIFPDTLVGTDSHTTMINGLGVLGWGVGGIEAEAAMLGQPIGLLVPEVLGFRLKGRLPEGTTATDLVLTITEMLRKRGVVGKFVEFFGPGLASLSLADRATLGNMSPEYGATCAVSPVDRETLEYLRFTGRPAELVDLVERYFKAQELFHDASPAEPEYSDVLELDLATVEPSIAGPRRPQDRIGLRSARSKVEGALGDMVANVAQRDGGMSSHEWREVSVRLVDEDSGKESPFRLRDGAVVIAAITSCTNTSNPSVMLGAGLLARKAVERGLRTKPWVKTSLAPGSQVVTRYLEESGLQVYLDALGFALVGYGCTTCIGNSGPLPQPISEAVTRNKLVVCSVLSGNRNFEGRISPEVRANFLASPPLVVAYALAGRMDIDLYNEPVGYGPEGREVYLRDIWPTEEEIRETMRRAIRTEMFRERYADVFTGDENWRNLPIPEGSRYQWEDTSTYIRRPPFFDGMQPEPESLRPVEGMRVLALLGDSVTTDHISPAGSIPVDSPAGRYLMAQGVDPKDFNSYGSRRGNHEVMLRGTFANVRLRNRLVPGVEGGYTRLAGDPTPISIYDAAVRYREQGIPLLVIAGKEYGSGSSRDWAAKGTALLGVRVVLAESFERIHRSNLIGMGVLPLQFLDGADAESLGLTGFETYDLLDLTDDLQPKAKLTMRAGRENGEVTEFPVLARVDTANEVEYLRHGGILRYVLRQLTNRS
ncbi:MAG TPA: aconitate hydratase AcnA [Acidobacteriota bacterium]|nr:aconitate hydratase AcnA [Acidobacteriota bacterium]